MPAGKPGQRAAGFTSSRQPAAGPEPAPAIPPARSQKVARSVIVVILRCEADRPCSSRPSHDRSHRAGQPRHDIGNRHMETRRCWQPAHAASASGFSRQDARHRAPGRSALWINVRIDAGDFGLGTPVHPDEAGMERHALRDRPAMQPSSCPATPSALTSPCPQFAACQAPLRSPGRSASSHSCGSCSRPPGLREIRLVGDRMLPANLKIGSERRPP